MALEYRLANAQDVDVLVEMRLEMRREREVAKLQVPEEQFRECLRKYFRQETGGSELVTVLVFDGENPVACASFIWQKHPPTYSNITGVRAYITNVYTRQQWRHKGIAAEMIRRICKMVEEAGCSELHLNASPMGRSLYLKLGFTELGGEMSLHSKTPMHL